MNTNKPILEMKNIRKSFNGVCVLDGVNFTLGNNEIVGLMGENGAGKSTLIKILCGAYQKDGGKIILDGKEVEIFNTEHSQELGIATIYQELSLFPTMTIVENIFMHRELGKGKGKSLIKPLDRARMKKEAAKFLRETLSLELDVDKRIEDISLAERQMVEIARAVYSNARIIIMDEPTAALANKEKERLFELIETLKKQQCSIIYISHHIDEVINICDRVAVLRDGHDVMDEQTKEIDIDDIINGMIGKSVENQYPKEKFNIGDVKLSIKNLTKKDMYSDISFDVHKKEIVGIVGLEGCGKKDILRTLFGLEKPDQGEIFLNGEKLDIKNINTAMKKKIAFLPAERKTEGILGIKSTSWNMSIAALNKFTNKTFINRKKEIDTVKDYISNVRIKVDSPNQIIASLSGGNQQKVMLSRWFLTDPEVLLLEEPTRGIDVNSKTEVYKLIMNYVKNDKCVVMVSSEEEEVLGICDRIIVVRDGKISVIMKSEEASLMKIKQYSVKDTEDKES